MAKKNKQPSTTLSPKTQLQTELVDSKSGSNNASFNPWPYLGAILLAVFGVYLFALGNEFLNWDDQEYVTNNKYMKHPLRTIKELLTYVFAGNYHPLTMLTMGMNTALFGQKAWVFILTNVIFHLGNTYLVYLFTKRLFELKDYGLDILQIRWVGLVAALLFGIHPLHVESVAWVSERKDVLYVFLFLLGLLQYLKTESGNRNLALLFFGLSCLAKGMAVVFPVCLVLIDYFLGENLKNIKLYVSKWPFFLISLLMGLLTLKVQGGESFLFIKSSGFSAYSSSVPYLNRIILALYSVIVYLLKFFIPLNLRHYYPQPIARDFLKLEFLLGAVVGLLFLVWLVSDYFRNRRIDFFAKAFFIVNLLLVLQVVAVGSAVIAERYTYLSYVGLGVSAAYYLVKWMNVKQLTIGMIVVTLVFGALVVRYIKTWNNTYSIWQNAYKYNTEDYKILANLADLSRFDSNLEQMLEYSERAIGIGWTDPIFYLNVGNYYALKNDTRTEVYLKQGLAVARSGKNISDDSFRRIHKDSYMHINMNLGQFYRKNKRYEESLIYLNEALILKPDSAESGLIHRQIGDIFLNQKKYNLALEAMNIAINMGHRNDSLYSDRAVARYMLGDHSGAIGDIKTALKINPNNIGAKDNYIKLGAANVQ